MKSFNIVAVVLVVVLVAGAYLFGARSSSKMVAFADASVVAQTRNLTPAEVTAAVQSFVPPGKRDEYMMFASGGHSGPDAGHRHAVDAHAQGHRGLLAGAMAGVRLRRRLGQADPGRGQQRRPRADLG